MEFNTKAHTMHAKFKRKYSILLILYLSEKFHQRQNYVTDSVCNYFCKLLQELSIFRKMAGSKQAFGTKCRMAHTH